MAQDGAFLPRPKRAPAGRGRLVAQPLACRTTARGCVLATPFLSLALWKLLPRGSPFFPNPGKRFSKSGSICRVLVRTGALGRVICEFAQCGGVSAWVCLCVWACVHVCVSARALVCALVSASVCPAQNVRLIRVFFPTQTRKITRTQDTFSGQSVRRMPSEASGWGYIVGGGGGPHQAHCVRVLSRKKPQAF